MRTELAKAPEECEITPHLLAPQELVKETP